MTMGSLPNCRFGRVKERRQIHPHPDPLSSRERVLFEMMWSIMIEDVVNFICFPDLY
jgi:hypothetical protein